MALAVGISDIHRGCVPRVASVVHKREATDPIVQAHLLLSAPFSHCTNQIKELVQADNPVPGKADMQPG